MGQTDVSLDVARAQNWIKEVEAELNEVKGILKQVDEEIQMKPYEDDTILNAFYQTGKAMEETWNVLGSQFGKVIEGASKVIQIHIKNTGEILETIGETLKSISLL